MNSTRHAILSITDPGYVESQFEGLGPGWTTQTLARVAPEVEGVGGVTDFLREVVKRGGHVVSVHFALDVAGLKLVAEDLQHRVLVYGAA